MARNENDMSGAAGAAEENAATQRARHRALVGDAAPSAAEIGEAVAKAMERVRERPPKEDPLPPVVRASVRCGYVTERRHSDNMMITRPGSITFKREETPDGREVTVIHGKPVKLKREAFLRYRREGKVVIAQ